MILLLVSLVKSDSLEEYSSFALLILAHFETYYKILALHQESYVWVIIKLVEIAM